MDQNAAPGRRETYQGDAALGRLLEKAGSRYDAAAVRALIAGVAAAPPAIDADAWMTLVSASPGAELRGQLRALFDEAAASFECTDSARWQPARLADLRAELVRQGLAGFVLPRGDEHQGEYVPASAERLAWLTGFQGSAGLAAVLAEKAAIFVDGRYTLQVRGQIDTSLFETRHITDEPASDWLASNAPRGGKIGFDPWLHTADGLARLREGCARAGAELVAVERNPIDAVWKDRPAAPVSPVVVHDLRFAGRSSADKRGDIATKLTADGYDAAVLSSPDSVAWLLNIRGGDVPHTPLPLSFAVVHANRSVDLFVDPRKLGPGLGTHLGNEVRVRPREELKVALDELGRAKAKVLADQSTAAAWITDRLSGAGANVVRGQDPCALPKACKNVGELDNTRAAHRRDGAALTSFLAWLAHEVPSGQIDELAASEQLLSYRRGGEHFRDLSFSTISGAGPNGAIVHYRATPETNRPIAGPMLYLVDSGAQYLDGTTDVTRTVAVGEPTPEQRDRFTRVLKGHIAIALQRFPRGTNGAQLDPLARRALWQVGLDYDHGTGHGVGSYLSVHEGPHRISKLPSTVPLQPGMIVSNEPGYYKTGDYGIRIENLVVVREALPPPGSEKPLLEFETITLAPIDLALVEPKLLTAEELDWLNAYHARVRETVGPLVDGQTRTWLESATRPLAHA
jgi:Xaa-Pro aminopeptidase